MPEAPFRPKPRQFEERDSSQDVGTGDAAERINKMRAMAWATLILMVAIPLGLLLGGFPWGLLGAFVAGGAVYWVTLGLTAGSARTMSMVHNPAGEIAVEKRDYSLAQSLAIRGDYAGALREYEQAVIAHTADPEPYIRIARIHRDTLHAPEEALSWLKRARTDATVGPGQERLITLEIIELYRSKLRDPQRAIPELARLVDRFPDDPNTGALREELAGLRRQMLERQDETGAT